MANLKEVSILIIGSLLLVVGIALWANYEPDSQQALLSDSDIDITSPLRPEEQEAYTPNEINMENSIAQITTNFGQITLELFTEQMPITTSNFITLAEDGFYDQTKFHRIIPGFMIQGGDPNSKTDDVMTYGTGGPGYTIQDEFVTGENLSNRRGTIAMANTGQPNSGGSQFFINVADNVSLDHDQQPLTSQHPVFGRVIEGMDVVDAIERVTTGARDIPEDPVIIESITVTAAAETDA